jgi:signal transduction histidine kinase
LRVKALTAEKVWTDVPAEYSFIINPPYWASWWFRILALLVAASVIYLFYRYRINQLKKLLRMRTRISRDLHDDVGSTLSGIGLLSEVAMQQLQNERKSEAMSSLYKINTNSEDMLEKMSDIVWAINPQNDSFEKVINRLKSYAKTTTDSLGVQFHFILEKDLQRLDMDMQKRSNVYLICKEAINNSMKYSGCQHLRFCLEQQDHHVIISIVDDGKGFNVQEDFEGNGLKNMKSRAEEINAQLNLSSEINKGTSMGLFLKIT